MPFHLSPTTGEPMWCEAAPGDCPFDDTSAHYETRAEARAAFAKKNQHREVPSFNPGCIAVGELPKGVKVASNTFILPKGVYILGDPAFTAGTDKEAWAEWRRITDADPDPAVGATYNGYTVAGFRVPEGGLFYDSQGRPYLSDSGVLGLIPVSLGKKLGLDQLEMFDDGNLLTLTETAKVEVSEGVLYVGPTLFVRLEPEAEPDADLAMVNSLLEEDEHPLEMEDNPQAYAQALFDRLLAEKEAEDAEEEDDDEFDYDFDLGLEDDTPHF